MRRWSTIWASGRSSPPRPRPTRLRRSAWPALRSAARGRALPIVAIGGIDRGNARAIMRAGADGVAVVSAICGAADPRAAASSLAAIISEARPGRHGIDRESLAGRAFAAPDLDPRLAWHCPPPSALTGASGLTVATAAGTDFWQGTHYGFRVDNGHALLAEADRDFVLDDAVRTRPMHQYDQAGLMVRLSPSAG